ncbi:MULTISPECIES: LD-carboxypeptidase [Arsenicicoccus]|uniref:S66 family peptidase n=1 Tax=Arsenicicoccus TaxID=267408 RepID=UPI0028A7AA9D|nr:LD-carboxypeptidase [Arsenicicoccus bolidensis]
MNLRFPAPLRPGNTVGVTSPSSGVSGALQARLDVALATVRDRGYQVVVGDCMDGSGHLSAPAAQRADELQGMLLDPSIRAVVPPWGGETAIDLIGLLDWEQIGRAEPTWVVGFSDIATLITPLTLVAGWATIHGNNLMDTPYLTPEGLVSWLDIVTLGQGATVVQTPPGRHRRGFVDYVEHPGVDEYLLDVPGSWTRLDSLGGEVDVTGRLVGGCIETLANLAGSRYLDTSRLAELGDGLLVYVEAAGDDAPAICRNLHGMRLNGVFDHARAVLVGRTYAPPGETLTQHEAVVDALGCSRSPSSRTSSADTGPPTCRSSTGPSPGWSRGRASRASRRRSPEPAPWPRRDSVGSPPADAWGTRRRPRPATPGGTSAPGARSTPAGDAR